MSGEVRDYAQAALACRVVTKANKAVLLALCIRARRQDAEKPEFIAGSARKVKAGWCWRSEAGLAIDSGLCKRTVIRAIQTLVDEKLVTYVQQGGLKGEVKAVNIYRVEYDALVAGATVVVPVDENDDAAGTDGLSENNTPNAPEEVTVPTPEKADKLAEEYAQDTNYILFDGKKENHEETIMKLQFREYLLGTAPSLAPDTFITSEGVRYMLAGLFHNKEWRNRLIASDNPVDFAIANLQEIIDSPRDAKSVLKEHREPECGTGDEPITVSEPPVHIEAPASVPAPTNKVAAPAAPAQVVVTEKFRCNICRKQVEYPHNPCPATLKAELEARAADKAAKQDEYAQRLKSEALQNKPQIEATEELSAYYYGEYFGYDDDEYMVEPPDDDERMQLEVGWQKDFASYFSTPHAKTLPEFKQLIELAKEDSDFTRLIRNQIASTAATLFLKYMDNIRKDDPNDDLGEVETESEDEPDSGEETFDLNEC